MWCGGETLLRLGQFENGRYIKPVPFRSTKWDDAVTKHRDDVPSSAPSRPILDFHNSLSLQKATQVD